VASDDDERFMREALREAAEAATSGEVPVGAVVVCAGEIVASAHNRRESPPDPLGHAEILALREAARSLGRWRLAGCTLYVSCEPCPMCAGAALNARVDRVVWGADDPKAGALGSVIDLSDEPRLNHRFEVTSGVLAEESATMLSEFFAAKRRDQRGD
jgi:tRNA(adenine34) deaminase